MLVSNFSFSADVTGKIKVISPNTSTGWNGVMIMMSDGKIVDPNCGNSTWALIKVVTELDKAMVSVALTAKTTQETVTVYSKECSAPPATYAPIPIVTTIDLGVR